MSPKGKFGRGEFPAADKYVLPRPRNRLLLLGLAGGVALLGLGWGITAVLRSPSVVVGSMSGAHANLANRCASCHDRDQAVSDARCLACHRTAAEQIGAYSFASHYVYQSDDFRRARSRVHESNCASCHPEHRGRGAALTHVVDSRCVVCHGTKHAGESGPHPAVQAFTSRQHPEFAAVGPPEAGSLRFQHDLHVEKVADQDKLEHVEDACRRCHVPRPSGASFQPISYERNCRSCHPMDPTDWLPLAADAGSQRAAVTGLRDLEQAAPGYGRGVRPLPDDFQQEGGKIRKKVVAHADAWVLFNLRRLRNILYPQSGAIADLVSASPEVEPRDAGILYREAVQTLENQMDQLAGNPTAAMRKDLQGVRLQLEALEGRLRDPATPLPLGPFTFDTRSGPARSPGESAEFDSVVFHLTRACQSCHQVQHATVVRVASNQRTFLRAKFDHRVHKAQRACLDCHQRIPIRALGATSKPAAEPEDHASIQNLPGRATCLSCHASGKADANCVTCHDFHPNVTRRSEVSPTFE